MSRVDLYLCDNPGCERKNTDPVTDGWIHIDCQGVEGCNIERGDSVLLANIHDRDYCSLGCFLQHLKRCMPSPDEFPPAQVNIDKREIRLPASLPKLGPGSRKIHEWIRDCPTLEECLTGFQERYPNRKLLDADLSTLWRYYHHQDPSPGLPEDPPGTLLIEEGDPYSDEEMKVLQSFDNHQDAWREYKIAFPGSRRKRTSIKTTWNRHWSKTEGEKRREDLVKKENDPPFDSLDSNSSGDELNSTPDPNSTPGELPSEKHPPMPFFVGAKVIQVKGKDRAFGVGDVTKIRLNGDLVVEFYGCRRTLPPDHFEFYQRIGDLKKTASAAATVPGGS